MFQKYSSDYVSWNVLYMYWNSALNGLLTIPFHHINYTYFIIQYQVKCFENE